MDSASFEGGKILYTCEKDMTIYTVKELTDELFFMLQQHESLVLNLASVSEIDAAGIQMLAMLKREAVAANKKMHLVAHNPAVINALETCALVNYFGDPLVISAKMST